jgi:hypothetical protein
MKKLLFIAAFCTVFAGFGQGIGDKLYFGGGLGFSGNSSWVTFSISPIVGYKITERLSAGVGISYQYTNYKDIDFT